MFQTCLPHSILLCFFLTQFHADLKVNFHRIVTCRPKSHCHIAGLWDPLSLLFDLRKQIEISSLYCPSITREDTLLLGPSMIKIADHPNISFSDCPSIQRLNHRFVSCPFTIFLSNNPLDCCLVLRRSFYVYDELLYAFDAQKFLFIQYLFSTH